MLNLLRVYKRIELQPETIVCIALALVGVLGIWVGLSYGVGSLTRMSSGFFPILVSSLLIIFSITTAVSSENRKITYAVKIKDFRHLFFITIGMLSWVYLIDAFGLIPATFGLIILSSLARSPFRSLSTILLSVALSLAGYLIFIVGLGMPLTLLGR